MRGDNTAGRQLLIRKLLDQQMVDSQEALVLQLAQAGHVVTQATVSRDLSSLGAVKLKDADGQEYYGIPDQPLLSPAISLARLMQQFVIGIESSGNLAVILTSPGGSGPVAAAIDGARLETALATVAGDDTILVVAREPNNGADLAQQLKSILGVKS
jgi:transcriptional regulator of arginine metabolism